MKTLPGGLTASLQSGVTTLAWCYKLTRNDGAVRGFTNHDQPLSFDSVTFQAGAGLTASQFAQATGLNVDTIDAIGALVSDALDEDDLAKGVWDGAGVEVWRADWSNVGDRVLVFAGSIGEVERDPTGFRAELRSLAHALNQPDGRIYSVQCDADLGDSRCHVGLASSSFTRAGTVLTAETARSKFTASGLSGFADSWFQRGLLTWTSGANAGLSMEVKRHGLSGASASFQMMQDLPFDIAAGDGFTVAAGCDKCADTCRTKFNNIANFRGFPFMVGNDFVSSYPVTGEGNDGGKLV